MLSEKTYSVFFGFVLFCAIAAYGYYHRWAAALILLLVMLSVTAFLVAPREIPNQVRKLRLHIIVFFLAIPLTYALSLVIHGEWIWREFDYPSRLLLFIPIFWAIVRLDIDSRFIDFGFLVGAVVIGVSALIFYEGRPLGVNYGNYISFGNIALALGVSAFILVSLNPTYSSSLKILGAIALTLSLVALGASGSRGGWIGLVLLSLFLLLKANFKFWQKGLFLGLFIAFVFGVDSLLLHNLISSRVDYAIRDVGCFLNDPYAPCATKSGGTRLWMFWISLQGFLDAPWLGNGFDFLSKAIDEGVASGAVPKGLARWGVDEAYAHAHNDILTLLGEQGLLGLVGYLTFMIGLIFVGIRLKSSSVNVNVYATALIVNVFLFFDFGLTRAVLGRSDVFTYLGFTSAVLAGMAIKHYLKDDRFHV